MRITGLATGLDMDEIIKNSMKPYRIKIDKKGQDREILEIKQKLYREVIKDSRELYNKYFDITKNDSLLLSRNWATTKFTSSNENVLTVTASGDAKVDNYTVTGSKATAAKYIKTDGIEKGNKITINGEEFTLKGDTKKEIANNLNNELKAKSINVNVVYTDFASKVNDENKSGLVFESVVLGKDSKFTVGGTFSGKIGDITQGIDATASIITSDSFTVKALKEADGIIKIDGKDIKIDISNDVLTNSDIEKILQNKLKDYKLSANVDESGKIIFKTVELGEKTEYPKISIGEIIGDSVPNIEFISGEKAKPTTNKLDLTNIANEKITINGNVIDLTGKTLGDDVVNHINKVLKDQGMSITASIDNGKVLLTSNIAGSEYDVDVKVANTDVNFATDGTDAEFIIKNSKGGVYTHKGIANTVTLDGVTFKFTGDIPAEGVSVNGKQNVTDIKDNLVKFINDYNTLVEKLNKLTTEKRNRSFNPLTADQKKEMSEDEIKLWNEKVQQGQLSRDTDVSRIANSLKQAMRSLVDGTGLNLEKIGIAPVADYQGTKNGTYTVDETKLVNALEKNSEQIMNMFINSAPKDDTLSEGQKYSKTGIMNRIKDVLYKETVTVTSSLLNKAGIEGSSTAYTNEITKSIEKYEQKIADMEKDFSRREQALYTKYANLETIMNKYNSQQSYLAQQLGLN
ncbi:MAG: flagellar filament capping protein FliD [Clostridium sp.]|uniref:flagellar filament capping protein FliD n=1 Tax=Clostridium sp. TaxID=1506 RepID=UPI0025B8C104|nr:flagellar filament capping protein FliD [Clostridium sp.]MCF0149602.1 flagellar filament capping protein FliD [Clostridium sp.]